MFVTTRSLTPSHEFTSLGNRINRMLNDMFAGSDWQYPDNAVASWAPPVDVLEEKDGIRIHAELPGVKPEDVQISIENNVLSISGTKQQQTEEKTEQVRRFERTYGSFARTFTLPATVDAANIKATYENGVLTVNLPKVEQAKPRQIPVEVSKS